MKILQINKYSTLNGGSEVVADTISRIASRQGLEVVTLGFAKPGHPPIHNSRSLGPENLTPLGMFHAPKLVQRIVEIAKAFEPDAIIHHNIYHHFPMAALQSALEREIQAPQTLIVHDHKPICAVYSGMRDGTPCHACSQNNYWPSIWNRCKDGKLPSSVLLAMDSFWNAGVKDVYAKFHRILSPSRYLAGALSGIGGNRDVEILMNPAPPPSPGATARDGIAFVGRLTESKGTGLLVKAVESFPDTVFRVAGAGDQEGALARLAERCPNLELLGRLSRDDVSALLARSRWTLIPSIVVENNPMVALESFARGTPILGSDLGGIPELVEDDKGMLFDHSRLDSYLSCLRHAMSEPLSRWEHRSRTCLTWAGAHTEEIYLENLIQLVDPGSSQTH